MIRLLKYDLRRNLDRTLSLLGLLCAAQLLLALLWAINDWDYNARESLSMLGHMLVLFLLIASAGHSYHYGLTTPHRRLLPVHPVKHAAASVVLGLIYGAASGLFFHIQAALENRPVRFMDGKAWNWIIGGAGTAVEAAFWFSLLFLCITVSCCFRWGGRRMIGFLLFLLLGYAVSSIGIKLGVHAGGGFPVRVAFGQFENEIIYTVISSSLSWRPMLYYGILAAAFIFLTGYLADKRVEE